MQIYARECAVVRLEFTLALGKVDVLAVVRHRNTFRYGFQFVETSSGEDVVARACRQLSVESSRWGCPSSPIPPPG
jgi:hypothetical protein